MKSTTASMNAPTSGMGGREACRSEREHGRSRRDQEKPFFAEHGVTSTLRFRQPIERHCIDHSIPLTRDLAIEFQACLSRSPYVAYADAHES
jgi:hypothetical protein